MFNDAGEKIKKASKAIFIFQLICFIILGIVMITINDELTFAGICVMIAGIFIGWFSSVLVYGFGELVEKTCELSDKVRKIEKALNPGNPTDIPISNPTTAPISDQSFDDEIAGTGKCEICGKDDRLLKEIKFNDGYSVTYKKVCRDCLSKMKVTKS